MSNYTPAILAFQVFEPTSKNDLPDLIVIHGLTSNKETWFEIPKDLADRTNRRVFALDMRNHGDSSWSEDFGWHIMAKDVFHFMKEHGIHSATLIGHSMGGIISMILALTEPEKIHSIIIEDISPVLKKLNDDDIIKVMICRIDLFQNVFNSISSDMDLSSAVKIASEEILRQTPPELQPAPEHRDKFAALLKVLFVKKDGRFKSKMNSEVIKKFLLTGKPHQDLEGLFKKPADFIYGTKSSVKVINAKDRILQLFPKAKLHAVEDATHRVHMEYPETFLEIVLQILSNKDN